jgi:hypothetical protein
MSESLSRTPIRIKVAGLGEAGGVLVRFRAPLTVETLLRRLPLEGRAHPIAGGCSFIVGIRRGEEKSVRKVEAGAIAYWPMGDALCIFHGSVTHTSPVNRVGLVTENLDLIRSIRGGVEIRLERATSG